MNGLIVGTLRLYLVLALCAGLAGCASHAKVTDGAQGASISAALAEAYDGPKARIAVGPVIDKSGATVMASTQLSSSDMAITWNSDTRK